MPPVTPRDISQLPLAPSIAALAPEAHNLVPTTQVAGASIPLDAVKAAVSSTTSTNESDKKESEKLHQLRIELTQARARVVRLVLARSSAVLYRRSGLLLHEWRISCKTTATVARDRRWKDQSEKLFISIAESNQQLVVVQQQRDDAFKQLKQLEQEHDKHQEDGAGGNFWQQMSAQDKVAALAVMLAEDKAAVLAAMASTPRKDAPHKVDNHIEAGEALQRVYRHSMSRACEQQMRNAVGVMKTRFQMGKAQGYALNCAINVCWKQHSHQESLLWAMARWTPAPVIAHMARQLEEQRFHVDQLSREVELKTKQIEDANLVQGTRYLEADSNSVQTKYVQLVLEEQQVREQLNTLQMASDAQGLQLANAQAQLEAALNRQHELGEQLRESEQSDQHHREQAVIVQQTMGAEMSKLTKDKSKHLIELQTAWKEIAKYSSRWNGCVNSFTQRRVRRRRDQMLRSMLLLARQHKPLRASFDSQNQYNLVRLFGRWAQLAVVR